MEQNHKIASVIGLSAIIIFCGIFISRSLPGSENLAVLVDRGLQTAQVSSTLSSGLVGYYSLDEGTGTTANDTSGSGNTGTFVGSPLWTAGKIGNALKFDGTQSYVSVSDSSSLRFGTGNFGIALWFKTPFTDANSWSGLIGKGYNTQAPGSTWGISRHSTDSNVITYNDTNADGSRNVSWTSNALSDGWHHLAVTRSAGSYQVYIDGSLVASPSASAADLSAAAPLKIGIDGGSRYLGGVIDEVRLYNRALSAQDVQTIYTYSGLVSSSVSSSDTQSPSIPSGLTASAVSTNQVNLSWSASTDNVGVAGYRVYRNGVLITTTSSLSYGDAGLASNTTYSYTIAAFDGAGNTSSQSAAVSATTQALTSTSFNISGATITATSPSYADVSAAVMAAKDGDTVVIPAGSATWPSTLTIDKAITLKGSGATATKIVYGGAMPLVDIRPTSDKAVRVTGIYFDLLTDYYTNGDRHGVRVKGSSTGQYALTKIRIDHNTFNEGNRQVGIYGNVSGVVDHNRFMNGDIAFHMTGDDDYAWNRLIAPGTANAMFVEDNTFIIDNNANVEPNHQIYHQEGGRTVIRNNTFDATTYTRTDCGSDGAHLCYANFFDSHGNLNMYTGTGYDMRGQPMMEVYNNTFKAYRAYNQMAIRGGSIIIHDNAFSCLSSACTSTNVIRFEEEEAWTVGGPFPTKPATTVWPAQDQINNSFVWANTNNGVAITDVSLTDAGEPYFIQKNRDYWMHSPSDGTSCSGGRTTYTDRQGGNETFTPTGPNAYYPYTSYTYPHPFVTAQDGTPTSALPFTSDCASTAAALSSSPSPSPSPTPTTSPTPTPTPAPAGDTTAPTITITQPLNGETWTTGRLTITANATDNVGIAGVTFYINNQQLGSEITTSPYRINWRATVGTYTITAKARDTSNNTKLSAPVTVTIVQSTSVKGRK